MARPARIVMYSQDSYGLGHLRRVTTLANSLVAARPDLSILLVVDSPLAPFFDLQNHIDFVKLPTVVKVDAGVFKPGRLRLSYGMVKSMRSTVIREVIAGFDADLLLVDHMPGGANRDLVPALRLIRALNHPTKVVLGVRDIIDNPAVTREVWKREGFYETLKRYYHSVLIYGSPEVFPTASAYGIGEALSVNVRYCGYVCNMDPIKEPAWVRAKLDLGEEPIIVVMAGGGADAFRLMETYLEALPLVNGRVRASTVMITGPFMAEEQRKALKDRGKALGIQIRTSIGDSLSHLNAADLVVSMAGYNTMSEILRFRKRAVIVPRSGPSAEQRMRASIFEHRGLVTMVDPFQLSPASLAASIVEAMETPAPPSSAGMPALHGVTDATDALLDLLDEDRRPAKSNGGRKQAAAGRVVSLSRGA
jgi:predicted glycosyltransferase